MNVKGAEKEAGVYANKSWGLPWIASAGGLAPQGLSAPLEKLLISI